MPVIVPEAYAQSGAGILALVTTQPGPAPKSPKPRILQDGRDMFWSMAPLVLACIVLAGLVGMCSFQPTGPAKGPAPSFDAADALRADAAQLGFPVRLPALPEGWQANSGRRGSVEGGRTDPATGLQVRATTSTVGYLSPRGKYVSLTQSNADEQNLIPTFSSDLVPKGVQDVDGVTWVVYEGNSGTRPVWTTRLTGPGGQTQVAISGAGSPEEFRTMAAATQSQPPLEENDG